MTNLQLGDEDGFRLLNLIRSYEQSLGRVEETPMIAIADYSDIEGETALAAGFQAYIRTPIYPYQLYEAMRQCLE